MWRGMWRQPARQDAGPGSDSRREHALMSRRPMLVAASAIVAAVPLIVWIIAQLASNQAVLGPWYAYLWLWAPIGLAWIWALADLPGMAWVELLAFFAVCAIGLVVTRLGSDVESA